MLINAHKQMKSEKTNKLALRVEKRSSFKKRGIKIRRHYLATIWPNFSQIDRAAVDL